LASCGAAEAEDKDAEIYPSLAEQARHQRRDAKLKIKADEMKMIEDEMKIVSSAGENKKLIWSNCYRQCERRNNFEAELVPPLVTASSSKLSSS